MPNLPIRDAPDPVQAKIRCEHRRRMVSQNADLISLLTHVTDQSDGPDFFKDLPDEVS